MFITLEGIEGSGKTTQVKHLVNFLESRGHKCLVTREPGGTVIGEKIRAILLDPENRSLDPLAELLLYMADRVQHINEKISSSLYHGKTVVCDRFYDATTVYQGYARGLDIEKINTLHQLALGKLKPDITLLFDLPAEVGLLRAWKQIEGGSRTRMETRFEKESIEFHKKVRNGYLELAKMEPDRFRIIDASRDEVSVKKSVIEILSRHIKK